MKEFKTYLGATKEKPPEKKPTPCCEEIRKLMAWQKMLAGQVIKSKIELQN